MKSIIIYATKYGCTEKVSNLLKSKMGGEVLLVNVIQEKVPDIGEYDTIILGGSIYIGKIHKKLTGYIKSNLELLLKKRIGLFICGSEEPEACEKELISAFPSELQNHAISKEVFGYEIYVEKLNFIEKKMMKAIKGVCESISELSEEKIESFAKKMM